MRATLSLALAAVLALAAPAGAGAPLTLVERQVTTLELDRPVHRVAVTDPDVLQLTPEGRTLRVVALRGGRTLLEVAFADGAAVTFDVVVQGARRPAVEPPR